MSSRVNWRQAAGEALILFLGVMFALGGQVWWEGREEERTVRGHVDNLLAELQANSAGLADVVAQHDSAVSRGTTLLRLLSSGDRAPDADSVLGVLSPLTLFSDYRPATAALDNLVGAGELGLFQNPSVLIAVSSYGRAIEDHNVLQAELAQFQITQFLPFLQREIPLLETVFATRVPEPRPEGRFSFALTPLVGSLEFENLLLRRIRSEGDASDFAARLASSIEELEPVLERLR